MISLNTYLEQYSYNEFKLTIPLEYFVELWDNIKKGGVYCDAKN